MSTQGQGDVVELEDRVRKMTHSLPPSDLGSTRAIQAITAFVEDELARLRTLLSSSRGEQGWRTIDSAPKDGTWFLICRDDEGPESYEVGCFDPQIWKSYEPAENGLYRQVEKVVNEWRGFNNFHRATHWMPLTSAPGSVPTSLAGQVPDGYVLVPKAAIRWLLGDGPDANGNYFGDEAAYNVDRGRYWWRSEFRHMLQSSPQPTAGGDAPK